MGISVNTAWMKLTISGDTNGVDCNGHIEQKDAPYISHLGYEHQSTTDQYQVFGLTSSHNWDKNEAMREAYVFRAVLQGPGLLSVVDPATDFKVRKVDISA